MQPATLKFYEAAFGLTTRFLHESGDYGELETGSMPLAFSVHHLMQQLGKNPQAASTTAPCLEIALCTSACSRCAGARRSHQGHAHAALGGNALVPDDCLRGWHQRLFGGAVHAHGLNTPQICYVFRSCLLIF